MPVLKPADAMHLATAVQVAAAEFHTYDRHLYQYATLAGLTICPPDVSACLPRR